MANQTLLEDIRRKQIFEATIRLISASGMHSVTMEEVAREAGLSKGGIADTIFRPRTNSSPPRSASISIRSLKEPTRR